MINHNLDNILKVFSVNSGYMAVSNDLMKVLGKNPTLLLSRLLSLRSLKKGKCSPITGMFSAYRVDLAEHMGASKDTVDRSIKKMEALGVITVERYGGRGHKCNGFIINDRVIKDLVSKGKQKKVRTKKFERGRKQGYTGNVYVNATLTRTLAVKNKNNVDGKVNVKQNFSKNSFQSMNSLVPVKVAPTLRRRSEKGGAGRVKRTNGPPATKTLVDKFVKGNNNLGDKIELNGTWSKLTTVPYLTPKFISQVDRMKLILKLHDLRRVRLTEFEQKFLIRNISTTINHEAPLREKQEVIYNQICKKNEYSVNQYLYDEAYDTVFAKLRGNNHDKPTEEILREFVVGYRNDGEAKYAWDLLMKRFTLEELRAQARDEFMDAHKKWVLSNYKQWEKELQHKIANSP